LALDPRPLRPSRPPCHTSCSS